LNLRQDGQSAETLAAAFLAQRNYRILARNYRVRLGEIDIIARDGDVVCFVEVKMRRTGKFGIPFEAIAPGKMRKIAQVAWQYLQSRKLGAVKARFDVVAVTPAENGFKFDLLKNAFGLNEAGGSF
jgi:putative endonuclease